MGIRRVKDVSGVVRWGAKFSHHGKQIWLGTFDTEEEARLAIQAAQEKVRGQGKAIPFPPPRRVHPDPVVYFVQAEDGGPIKIGRAHRTGVRARLGGIQTGNPKKLRVLGTIDGGVELEAELHKRFALHRLSGEWFEPVPELLALLEGGEPPPRYATIVADPPWPFKWSGGVGGAHRNATPLPYSLATLEEICALPVEAVTAEDAHLFLWVTPELYRQGEGVRTAEAWGFEPVDELIWEKPNIGMGVFPRHVHEPVLIARRGNLPFGGPKDVRSVQRWSQRHAGSGGGKVHSAKPDGLLDLVEQVSPGPYLELFARRARFGWDYWGDESLSTVEIPTEEAA